MDYQNTEKEIDLVDLIFHLLFKWRSLLVAALIGFVVLGAYKYVTTEQLREKNDILLAEGNTLEVKYPDGYEKALSAWEKNETKIRTTQAKIDEYQLAIDNANETIKTTEASIKEKQARVESAKAQLEQYEKAVLSDKSSEDYSKFISDYVTATQTVSEITDSLGLDYATVKEQKKIILENQNLTVEEEKNLTQPKKDALDLKKDLENATPSSKRSLKDGIKYGIIGFFVGAIVLAGIYCLGYVFNNKLHTADEISVMFNIPLLAVMNRQKPKRVCFIDKWFMSWRGDNKNVVCDEEKVKTAAVSLNSIVKKGSTVGIITSAKIEDVTYYEDTLNANTTEIKFITVENSTKLEKSAKLLASCDSVVLLEMRESTKFSDIEEEVRQVNLLNKPVLGCIIC